MRVALRTGTLCLCFSSTLLLMTGGPGRAQAPAPVAPPPLSPQPITGFVPPYEIMRTVRAAGFDPLAPPLREGTTYVLRATDFRGILMRVVLDARTGAIRDVSRIVPGPGTWGQIGMAPPPYGAPQLDAPPPVMEPPPLAPPEANPTPPQQPATRLAPRATTTATPLPRPRPTVVAARKPADAENDATKADAKIGAAPGGKAGGAGGAAAANAPAAKPDTPTSAPAAPKRPPPAVPFSD